MSIRRRFTHAERALIRQRMRDFETKAAEVGNERMRNAYLRESDCMRAALGRGYTRRPRMAHSWMMEE